MVAHYGSIIVYLLSHTSDGLKSECVPNIPLKKHKKKERKKRQDDKMKYSKAMQ